MARIPIYEQQTTPNQLLQAPKMRSGYVPSPVGRAIAGFGESIGVVANNVDKYDGLVAEEKVNQARALQSELAMNEKDGFLNVKGKAAIEPDQDGKTLSQRYMGKFAEEKAKLTAGMNDNQLIKFNQKSQLLDLDLKNSLLKHQINEADRYADDVFKGTLVNEQNIVGRDYNNPTAFRVGTDRVMQAINAYADRKGLPDEMRNSMVSEQTSKLHSSVLSGALAKQDIGFADRYLKTVKDTLTPDDALKFTHMITTERNRLEAQSEKYATGTIFKMVLEGKSDQDIFGSAAFNSLPAKDKIQMMGSVNNARNIRAEATPDLYARYYDLATDPQKLKTMTEEQIFAMTPDLGQNFVRDLLKKRSDIGKNPDAVSVDDNQLKQIAKEYSISDKTQLGRINYDVSNLVSQEQARLGRKLSYDEKDTLIRKSFVKLPVETKGFLWGTTTKDVPFYALSSFKQEGKIAIPAADRTLILKAFTQQGIAEPSETQIIDAYINLKKK